MKNRPITYLILALCVPAMYNELAAQDQAFNIEPERIQLCTDRALYISGEEIQFSAFISGSEETPELPASRILYCELITADGSRISDGKFSIEQMNVQGCLSIPPETLSGFYYLKTYTRALRNFGQDHYHFIRLKIINPDREEVFAAANADSAGLSSWDHVPEAAVKTLNISVFNKNIQPGEEIRIRIERLAGVEEAVKYCLAVVPEAAVQVWVAGKNPDTGQADEFSYYPETRGITLSGRISDQNSGQYMPNAIVNLSVIGDKDIMALRTDPEGRFFFPLPSFHGSNDIFLCAEDIPGLSPVIFIDNDFCTQPVRLPSPEFALSEKERETALNMARNEKIRAVFYADNPEAFPKPFRDSTSFYGKPDEILVMDKYIDLPTMEDYFQELVGAVNVRKFEGRKLFRFNSPRAEMTIFNPLVLIDWVAVDDIDRILAISPVNIARIELVNAPYIKGSITYGGIISFVSKNYDYAGVDLPASGTFIHYDFLKACVKDSIPAPNDDNLPDPRNTVYWDPDLKLDPGRVAEISVTAPATPGRYSIVVTLMGKKGMSVIREEVEIGDRK